MRVALRRRLSCRQCSPSGLAILGDSSVKPVADVLLSVFCQSLYEPWLMYWVMWVMPDRSHVMQREDFPVLSPVPQVLGELVVLLRQPFLRHTFLANILWLLPVVHFVAKHCWGAYQPLGFGYGFSWYGRRFTFSSGYSLSFTWVPGFQLGHDLQSQVSCPPVKQICVGACSNWGFVPNLRVWWWWYIPLNYGPAAPLLQHVWFQTPDMNLVDPGDVQAGWTLLSLLFSPLLPDVGW